jgi:hypothetical protein
MRNKFLNVLSSLMLSSLPVWALEPTVIKESVCTSGRVERPQFVDRYKDETVSAVFEKGEKDLPTFINCIMSEHFGGATEPEWWLNYRSALESMLKHDWKQAQFEITKAQIVDPVYSSDHTPYDGPRLPDVLMVSAILDKMTDRNDECLAHLTEMYELHKKAPSLWENSELFHTTYK